MPRRKSSKAKNEAAEIMLVTTAEDAAPIDTPNEPPKDAAVYAADPHPKLTVSLSDYNGGPKARLLRCHKFNQMQIRFEGEQPPEAALAILKDTGWRDRTEAEGVFTKQIDKNARWQSVDQMEKEFKAIVNRIREEKGLEPALDGPVLA